LSDSTAASRVSLAHWFVKTGFFTLKISQTRFASVYTVNILRQPLSNFLHNLPVNRGFILRPFETKQICFITSGNSSVSVVSVV